MAMGLKRQTGYLDDELKKRVMEAVGELAALGELKKELKECKY